MVRDLVSAVWAYVVVFDPAVKLDIENSLTICWDLERIERSAGVMREVCNARTTSTLSNPCPSSPSAFLLNKSRKFNSVFEHRTKALWSSFCPGTFTGFPVPPTSASCISSCRPNCRHRPTALPNLTVSHNLVATARTSSAVSYLADTSFSSLLYESFKLAT